MDSKKSEEKIDIVDISMSTGWEFRNADSKETVRKIIAGSKAIDRMRQEIDSVVKTVLGLIQQECDSTSWIDVTGQIFHPEVLITLSDPYTKGVCGWSVTGWTTSGGHRTPGWMAQCSLSDPFNLGSQIYCSNESYSVSLQNVKTVHDNLGVFVEKMIKKFPFLIERLQPLLDAADSKPSQPEIPTDDRKSRELFEIAVKLHDQWRSGIRSFDDLSSELFLEARRILHSSNR